MIIKIQDSRIITIFFIVMLVNTLFLVQYKYQLK